MAETESTSKRSSPKRDRAEAAKAASAFRTIGEVADSLGVAQHVLRFWEKKFHQVRPVKRNGGRRYYRVEDIELLREIRSLLHDQGYTIRGVQKLLREGGLAQAVRARATGKKPAAEPAAAKPEKASEKAAEKAAKKLHSDDLRQVSLPFDLLQDMSGLKAVVKATLADLEGLRAELAARQNR
ncbi:MerR family transcriptional regulator [Ferrovibrio sp.]|uniref:MerR family transcriptional regulator n=1 Tax=Ferrovibrio sp. TaxID=1917215 RepID=UPI003D2B4D47